MNFSRTATLQLWVCYGLILSALVCTGCLPATDRAVIEEPPTPVSTYQIVEEREQLLHRREAQRLAAQAVATLNHRQDATFDLPLLLAREAVLTTWATDGYVTVEADRVLRTVLFSAMADPALSIVSQRFSNPPIFGIKHDAADTWTAAITPDGHILAVATNDDAMGPVNSIRLWDMTTKRFLGKLEGVPANFIVQAMAFSPDGTTLLTVSPLVTILWDWRTSQQRVVIPVLEGAFLTGTFSPDGQSVALAGEKVFVLVDTISGRPLHHFTGQVGPILSVAFDPKGEYLLTAAQNDQLRLWEIASEQQIGTIGNQQWSYALATFSPDGSLIAVSGGPLIQVWDFATRKLLYELAEASMKLPSFSRDGKYLLVKASLFELATGSVVRYFTDDLGSPIFQATFAPDDESVIAVVNNYTVEIWPTVERMLLYTDALIQRDPSTFTEWELRHFELGQAAVASEYQLLDARPLVPFATPMINLTPRPRPDTATLSPLPTPKQ